MAATANKPARLRSGATRHGHAPLAAAFSVLLLALHAGPAGALEWKFTPRVGAQATLTDNANQSHSDPQEALILSVTPGFTVRSQGSRRVQASLQYNLNGVSRFGNVQSDNLYHNLNATGRAELVKDLLFIDGNARVSQELLSLQGSPADATTNNSNRTTVGTYSISPYIQKRLGTFAFAQARYTASGAIFQNNAAANANSNSLALGLSSGTRFTDFSWGLNYSLRKVQNRNAVNAANNTDVTFESASATAGYALTRQFRIFGTVGQDSNDYFSATGTSGSFYSVGFGWAPTRRTSFEASVGERYFGRTFSLAGDHRTRLTRWRVRYSENVSDISQQFLEQSSRIFWVCNGSTLVEAATDPGGCVGPITAGELALFYSNYGVSTADLIAAGLLNVSTANGIFIIKTLNAGVSWDLGKLGFGLSAQDTKRLYQAFSNAQDHVQGLSGSVSYRLSATTTANSVLSFTRTSIDGAVASGVGREDNLWSLSLGLNRRYSDTLYGALTFRHTERSSNVVNAEYQENSLMASVNKSF